MAIVSLTALKSLQKYVGKWVSIPYRDGGCIWWGSGRLYVHVNRLAGDLIDCTWVLVGSKRVGHSDAVSGCISSTYLRKKGIRFITQDQFELLWRLYGGLD